MSSQFPGYGTRMPANDRSPWPWLALMAIAVALLTPLIDRRPADSIRVTAPGTANVVFVPYPITPTPVRTVTPTPTPSRTPTPSIVIATATPNPYATATVPVCAVSEAGDRCLLPKFVPSATPIPSCDDVEVSPDHDTYCLKPNHGVSAREETE